MFRVSCFVFRVYLPMVADRWFVFGDFREGVSLECLCNKVVLDPSDAALDGDA